MAEAPNEYRLGTADPVMLFELMVSSWCNYECTYCVATVHKHREASQHAFDHHPVERWIEAFARVPSEFALLCRGGEPFLDDVSFARFLSEVGRLEKLRYLRVDTNGSWDPARYESVPEEVRRATELNVSFHPTQISLDRFEKRLAKIVDAGWTVRMINYVLEALQADEYASVRDRFRKRWGIYVNPNPDAFDESWATRDLDQRERARRALLPLLPLPDLLHKTGAPPKGKSCFFPAISYFIAPNGAAQRSCGVHGPGEPRTLDFVSHSARVKPLAGPVTCPLKACLCLDRYAFREDLAGRGHELDLLAEYVRDCTSHQAREGRTTSGVARRALSTVSSWLADEPKEKKRKLPVVPGG